ncbi:MAG: glycosyltransferase family 39 protein, partial [Planctomycetia bacterium]|nr:glycosyltransferase family 39 protein [Planctomycetia bacterium]
MADARVFHWLRSLAIPHWLLLALAAGLLCFMHLRAPLQEPQEARYAEIPRQMLAEGSWLTPILHGQPYYDKPPLFYWLVMASYSVCGVHDWAARWLACALAWGCILVAYAWGRAVLPARAALLGGLMLCLSPRFLQLDRMVTMDGLLCLCVTAAWASAHRALRGPQLHRGWWLLSALATGLGLLTKGPIALVLFVPPVLALRWLDP